MIEPIARFVRDNPPQFPIVKAPVQAFEALQFLHGRFGHPTTAPPRAHLDMGGEEAKHPLLLKASFELADRVGMEMRVCRPLCRGALVQQDWANDLIASLNRIVKAQWQLGEVWQLFHGRLLPCGCPRPAWPWAAEPRAVPLAAQPFCAPRVDAGCLVQALVGGEVVDESAHCSEA